MQSTDRIASGGCPDTAVVIAAFSPGRLIAGSIMNLAAFNEEPLAAREHMVRTDPGALSQTTVA
jgi:hypothetical protein